MTRSSFPIRLARLVQRFPLWIFQVLEWPLIWLLERHSKPKIIFILALPRSGSTVTYQVLAHALNVQYLSNIGNLFYQLPLVGGWLARVASLRHHSDFKSTQGFVGGINGPAEGLRFWSWWLDSYLSDEYSLLMHERKRQRRAVYLRRVLASLTRRGKPFVTAYLGHSLMPDTVSQTFPEAILIRLHRDPVNNALSILKCMTEEEVEWFSLRPKECHDMKGVSKHERVAAQVYWLNRRLDDAEIASSYLNVKYEALCANPTQEVARILDFCKSRGWHIAMRNPLPESFPMRVADVKNDPDARKIASALHQLEKRHGKLSKV